jgi:hypothetical protein
MNLEDAAIIFHESEDCPGVITSDDMGELRCSECGRSVGRLDRLVLREIIAMLSQVPPRTR